MAPKREIRRNAQGQLRLHDADGEIGLPLTQNMSTPPRKIPAHPASSEKSVSSSQPLPTKTPFQDIFGSSPGSESQNRRRRLILEGLDLEPAKRQRVHFDGSSLSPVAERTDGPSAKSEVAVGAQSPTLVENASTVSVGIAAAPITLLSSPLWREKNPADADNRMAPISFFPPRSTQADVKISIEVKPARPEGNEAEALVEAESPEGESHANTPGSEADSIPEQEPVAHPPNRPQYSTDENDQEIKFENPDYWTNQEGDESEFFFDPVDSIWRCQVCGHEMWSETIGFCTMCKEEFGCPVYENPGPGTGNTSESEVNEVSDSAEAGIGSQEEETSPFLDCDSSAYDSQDDDLKFNEEYEINSFIDDATEVESEDENKDDSDEEVIDWQARYQSLITAHAALSYSYNALDERYHDYRIAIEGDAYETSNDSDMDEMDENGTLLVDVAVPDPVVTELILSQAQEQSQGEEISEARVKDRVEAFQAASNENGHEWNDISMLSTGDNHTFPEIEL